MKSVIFDLDGVLVSTDKLHAESLIRAVYEVTHIDTTSHPAVSPKSMMSTKEKLKTIQEYYRFTEGAYDRILKKKDEIFLDSVKFIKITDNVIAVLTYLRSTGIKTAIASNSRHTNIDAILCATGIKNFFDVVVSAEDVPHRKPAPDILFEVYKRLNLTPDAYSDTLFIEDSDEGVEAGNNSPSVVLRINSPSELTVELLRPYIT